MDLLKLVLFRHQRRSEQGIWPIARLGMIAYLSRTANTGDMPRT